MYNHTVFGFKSAAMNADRMRPEDLPLVKSFLITDRNTSYLNVNAFVKDVQRMRENPNLVIMVARRNTTYTIDALGKTSFAIEGGHGESMKALPDKIGTGWGNFMRVLYWDVLREFSDSNSPFVSFADRQDAGVMGEMNQLFGIVGFTPNAVGISEDYWAVVQQYHNMVGLGRVPEMALSEGLGHKVDSKDQEKLEDYQKEQEEIKKEAEEKHSASQHHLIIHQTLAKAVTFFQVAIAISAISVLMKKRRFWFLSLGFGIFGFVFLIQGLLQSKH
jgi:hypothetical protein